MTEETEALWGHSFLKSQVSEFQSWAQAAVLGDFASQEGPLFPPLPPPPSDSAPPSGWGASGASRDLWMKWGSLLLQDMKAHTSIPLLGYQVTPGPQGDPRAFQLQQSGQQYTFKAESEELQARWVRALRRAASGRTPEGPDEEGESD